jgi:NTP pyrophosphatase (non-canonical NTP hydrolase)
MQTLPEKPTLTDLQAYIAAICKQRGWDKNSHTEIFMLFIEEIGELAKAMRNAENLYQENIQNKPLSNLREEFADVLNYLLDLANHFNVDLEAAFREKDNINKNRQWD